MFRRVGVTLLRSSRLQPTMSTSSRMTEDKVSSVFKKLKVGPMKRLYQYYTPGAVNLAGGLPMESTFPFHSLDVHVSAAEGDGFTLTKGKDLSLNYHRGDGLPVVKEWISQHVKELHNPPNPSTDTCVTVGSTDSWAKVLTLIDTDVVMYDQYAYGAAVNASNSFGKQSVGVATDSEGMLPGALRESVLTARENNLKANLVYFVPVGQNPTGNTISQKRKEELYEVCRELDVIIVEDDAYYYLYFDLNTKELVGIDNLPKTFLSMDTDGRVLRFDSLSKFISPGTRVGWISGPSDFIAKFLLLQEVTVQFPSSFSQTVFHGLMKYWGRDGLHKHVQQTQLHYKNQCEATISALKEFMPAEHCSYDAPYGGMFLWLNFHNLGSMTSFELFRKLADAGVICVPGEDFLVPDIHTTLGKTKSSNSDLCLRLTFAAASPAQIRAGIEKLGVCIKDITASQKSK